VIAVDTGAEKKKLCLSLGADCFIDFKESKDLIEEIKKVCGGIGPHAAVIASSEGAAYNQALEYLRPHGTLVGQSQLLELTLNLTLNNFFCSANTIDKLAVGMPPDTFISASVFWTVFRALRIVGSYVGNRFVSFLSSLLYPFVVLFIHLKLTTTDKMRSKL
jgi:propanol-preferring alcohol dehydrogenase